MIKCITCKTAPACLKERIAPERIFCNTQCQSRFYRQQQLPTVDGDVLSWLTIPGDFQFDKYLFFLQLANLSENEIDKGISEHAKLLNIAFGRGSSIIQKNQTKIKEWIVNATDAEIENFYSPGKKRKWLRKLFANAVTARYLNLVQFLIPHIDSEFMSSHIDNRLIFWIFFKGHIETLKLLADRGVLSNFQFGKDFFFIHLAHLGEFALDKGVSEHAKLLNEAFAFDTESLIIRKNQTKIKEWIIGATDAEIQTFYSPGKQIWLQELFEHAVIAGYLNTVRFLIPHINSNFITSYISIRIIFWLFSYGYTEMVKLLLKAKDTNGDFYVNLAAKNNKYIRKAVFDNNVGMVKLLLEAKDADGNFRVDPAVANNLAIRRAVDKNNIGITKLLLEAKNPDGSFPVDFDNEAIRNAVVQNGYSDIMKLLLEAKDENGAFRFDPAADDNAAIIMSVEYDRYTIMKLLLEAKDEKGAFRVDPAARNNAAIRLAAEYRNDDAVKLLLSYERVTRDLSPEIQQIINRSKKRLRVDRRIL